MLRRRRPRRRCLGCVWILRRHGGPVRSRLCHLALGRLPRLICRSGPRRCRLGRVWILRGHGGPVRGRLHHLALGRLPRLTRRRSILLWRRRRRVRTLRRRSRSARGGRQGLILWRLLCRWYGILPRLSSPPALRTGSQQSRIVQARRGRARLRRHPGAGVDRRLGLLSKHSRSIESRRCCLVGGGRYPILGSRGGLGRCRLGCLKILHLPGRR